MSAEKRRVAKAVRQLRAMCLLSCGLTAKRRVELDDDIRRIPEMHKRELMQLEEQVTAVVRELLPRLGLRKSLDECLAYVEEMEHSADDMPWLQKHGVDQDWFSNLGGVVPKWNLFPPHTRFGIDVKGYMPSTLEFRLLEASLFESTALLWNDAVASETHDRGMIGDAKIPWKRHQELKRSTVRAVFALIEGYLNGIALDVELTIDINSLSAGARELILERRDVGKISVQDAPQEGFRLPSHRARPGAFSRSGKQRARRLDSRT